MGLQMLRKILMLIILVPLADICQAETTVSFAENNIRTNVGETFTADIVISNITPTRGGGITLQFDPAVLSVSNVAVDTNTWSFVSKVFGMESEANGIIDIWFASWNFVSGNVPVATVTFRSLDSGNVHLRLQESETNPFLGNDNQRLQVSFKKTVVHVRP
jgi:hypothetical protein